MRICHITSAHDSDDVRILKKQCVSLAKDNNNKVYLVAKGESYVFKNVNVVGIGESAGGRIARVLKTSRLVYKKAIEIDADVYQIHDPELLLYTRALKKRGKKVIFDSHENYSMQISEKHYIPRLLRRIIAFAYRTIENRACKYIDMVFYPTDENPYIDRVKDCVSISNVPIFSEFNQTIEYDDKEDCVCCVGSLSESRGIKVLVEACYKANVKLILGGLFSPPSFGETLMEMKEFSIVDYRGLCSREEVRDIYSCARIGADTILDVGQYRKCNAISTKVYEYMINGMPFITSDFEYNIRFLNSHGCGVSVNPSDSDQIAEAILYLINNRETAKQMGQNGKHAALIHYSWEQEEKKLYDAYKRLFV